MANIRFNKSSSRADALASTDGNKVFFPNDSNAVVMGGKEYGMSPCAVRSSEVTAVTGGTTASRYYGVESDSSGKAFVNVPWANSTYSNLSLGQGLGTCTTAASVSAKVVSLPSYKLVVCGVVAVRFTCSVGAGATMAVNSCAAKSIFLNGSAIKDGVISAGDTAIFMYSGGYYNLLGVMSGLLEIDVTSFIDGSAATGSGIGVTGGNDSNLCMHRFVATVNGCKVPLCVSKDSDALFLYYITGLSSSGISIRYAKFSIGSSGLTFTESGNRSI